MKKKALATLLILVTGLQMVTACGNTAASEDTANYATAYMEQDHTYRKTTNYLDESGQEKQIVMEGTYVADPYEEHITVVEGESMWDEVIYSGDGDTITAKIHTRLSSSGTGWLEQEVSREYPYGYGEELSFDSIGEEVIHDMECEAYSAEYVVDLAEEMFLDVELSATVYQTYYVDKETDSLVRIDTDLTELTKKTFIANDMNANGSSLEDAEKNAESRNHFKTTEILEIYYN